MPNLLASEPSASLKSAAHQPVHWHPWGEAAPERPRVAKNAKAIRQHLTEALNEAKAGQVSPAILADAAGQMARLFDIRYGGFGTAPKFPHPAGNDFLLARWHDTREAWIREVVEKSLTGMAKGGIRDHLGGGFHRYAVDERASRKSL